MKRRRAQQTGPGWDRAQAAEAAQSRLQKRLNAATELLRTALEADVNPSGVCLDDEWLEQARALVDKL